MSQRPIIPIALHPPQAVALQSQANEILYGGAAGGGKSYLIRVAALTWCLSISGLHVYLFRRLLPDLIKTHLDGVKGFRALLAPLVQAKQAFITEDEVRFKNGSKIYLCHCKDEKDVYKYLSSEIHVLLIDELTTFSADTYRFLRSRVRCVGVEIPPNYQTQFPRILCGSNPGNLGHSWVKSAWIDNHIPLEIWEVPESEGGMRRQFIPAKLDDNPSLIQDDPLYEQRLSGLGSPALVRAYRDGDWNIIAGAFFPEFSYDKHVIRPIQLPKHWTRFVSFDWGSSDPFCVLWFAISDGIDINKDGKHVPHEIPRGTLVVYREWYGYTGEPNKGLKLPNHEIAKGIVEREALDPKIAYRVAGHDIWIKKGGPSIAEDMEYIDFEKKIKSHIVFDHAVIDRINGHAQFRSRLVGDERGAGILFFNTCVNCIRTIPILQHDPNPNKSEDILDHMEDHCLAGDTKVITCYGNRSIKDLVGTIGIVLSWDGKSYEYKNCRLIKKDASLVELKFDNNSKIRCTPDHKFLSSDGRWIQAMDLLDTYCYDLSWSLSLATQNKSSITKRIIYAAFIFSAKAKDYIDKFGNTTVEKFQKDSTSTTSITTDPIIRSKISKFFQKVLIAPYIRARQKRKPEDDAIWRKLDRLHHFGISLRKVANGIVNTIKTLKRNCIRKLLLLVWFVVRKLHQFLERGSVRMFANQNIGVKCILVTSVGNEDVYCMEVPKLHNFALENNVISSNCYDTTRYGCMSRPWHKTPPEKNNIIGLEQVTMDRIWKETRRQSKYVY